MDSLILHSDSIPQDFIVEIKESLEIDGVNVVIKSRPDTPFASMEWFIPAAVMIFFGKEYLFGFFKKLGQNNADAVSKSIANFRKKLGDTEMKMIGSKGKVNGSFPYSLMFAIQAQYTEETMIKFMVPIGIGPEETGAKVECFLAFLRRIYDNKLRPKELIELTEYAPVSKTIFVTADSNDKIEFIHPA